MRVLNNKDLMQALPMPALIDAMKKAYAALSAGKTLMPLRSRLEMEKAETLVMPAFAATENGDALAVKIVNIFPENRGKELPLLHAIVVAMDAETGQIRAILEGAALTALRTGAGSGAATEILARPDSHIAGIIGAGVQARTQLRAICAVRPIQKVWVYAPQPDQVSAFIEEMAGQAGIPTDVQPAASAPEAIQDADIICAATTSPMPVFPDDAVKPGAHINGVGSYTPQMAELPAVRWRAGWLWSIHLKPL